MFAYCGNNPAVRIDPSGTEYSVIGAGIQVQANIDGVVVGMEIICFWDVDECANGGITIAVYGFAGVSMDVNDPLIGSVLSVITDNSDLLTSGTEAGLLAVVALLKSDLSLNASGLLITGNEHFTSTESYEKSFTSINGSAGKVNGSISYSDSCVAYSLGYTVAGTSQLLPKWGISKTYYQQLFEITLFANDPVSYRKSAGGRKSILERDLLRM